MLHPKLLKMDLCSIPPARSKLQPLPTLDCSGPSAPTSRCQHLTHHEVQIFCGLPAEAGHMYILSLYLLRSTSTILDLGPASHQMGSMSTYLL